MAKAKASQQRNQKGKRKLILGAVTELDVVTVLERGIANKECIAVSVKQTVNLGRYGLMLAQHDANTSTGALPYFDNLFWFGDGIVNAGDWLFVYTGPGDPTSTPTSNGANKSYRLHWRKQYTVFANSMIVPVLFRVDAVNIPLPPANQPQLPKIPS